MTSLTVIYGGERLTLKRDLVTDVLMVHLSTPPAVIELDGHALRYESIEFVGFGAFEIRNRKHIPDPVESALPTWLKLRPFFGRCS